MLSDNASILLFLDIDSAIYMHELALQKNPKYLYQHIIPLSLFFFISICVLKIKIQVLKIDLCL